MAAIVGPSSGKYIPPHLRAQSEASLVPPDPGSPPALMRERAPSAPPDGSILRTASVSGILPDITLTQLQKLRPPAGTAPWDRVHFPAPTEDALEKIARMAYDLLNRAEQDSRAGHFDDGKAYRHVYREGRRYDVTGAPDLIEFKPTKDTYALRDPHGDISLYLPRRGTIARGGTKEVFPIWIVPLTRIAAVTKGVLLTQPRTTEEGDCIPTIREETWDVRRGLPKSPYLKVPDVFIRDDRKGLSVAVQRRLEFADSPSLSPHARLATVTDAAQALKLMHKRGRIHGDVRTDNIVAPRFDVGGRLVEHGGLADFGETHRYTIYNGSDATSRRRPKCIGHLSMTCRPPEEQYFIQLAFEQLDRAFPRSDGRPFSIAPYVQKKYEGTAEEPGLLPPHVLTRLRADLAELSPLWERSGAKDREEAEERVLFYVGPEQDMYQFGLVLGELFRRDFQAEEKSPMIGELATLTTALKSPDPAKRPSADEAIEALQTMLEEV